MDWKYLFLDSKGRIGQKDFWIGFAILFIAGLVLGMIPVLGGLIGLVMIYPNVCLVAKRLHDFGKSGWLAAVPYVLGLVAGVGAFIIGGATLFAAGAMDSYGNDEATTGAALAGMGSAAALLGIFGLLGLAFLLWVGLSKGDPAPNQYGPPRDASAVTA